MIQEITRPDTTTPTEPDPQRAARTSGPLRHLYSAGWTLDATTEMSDGSVEHDLLRSGERIGIRHYRDGRITVTLTGLDMGQLVGAVTGAGLHLAAIEPTLGGVR